MIVYLHGFNSSGGSAKAAWLRRQLSHIDVLSPTYPAHVADEAPAFLRKYFADLRRNHPSDKKLLLVGSSMGGFWARYLAPELGAGMALINPSLHPEIGLLKVVGINRNLGTGEEYELTEAQVLAACNRRVPTLVLLDEADEVIDYREAEAFYRECGRVVVYPGGSHQFDHLAEALPEILALYDSL